MKKRLLLLFVTLPAFALAMAQADCFTFRDEDAKTQITGLTQKGYSAKTLTIPSQVTDVFNGALSDAERLENLVIDGGNPSFETNAFEGCTSTVTLVKMGSGMSVTNMKSLLLSLKGHCDLSAVEIDGCSGGDFSGINWTAAEMEGVLKSTTNVNIPAELVGTQVFGEAQVCGGFELDGKQLKSFCGSATFYDENDGGNFLFYIPTKLQDGQLYIKRVRYIEACQGVLMHNSYDTADLVYLPRVDGAYTPDTHYPSNMLVGVTEPTAIGATETKGEVEYTNMILKSGAFHKTSGGTLNAHRAYLQVKTSDLASLGASRLSLSFDDGTTGITHIGQSDNVQSDNWYDLSGRRIENPKKGIFIHNGRKEVVR